MRDEREDLDVKCLLPRVVHRDYFGEVLDGNGTPEDFDRFGIIRFLGSEVISFLAYNGELTISNVHSEHLEKMHLSEPEAYDIAIENLRRLAFDGVSIQQNVTASQAGFSWATWVGNTFASSCLLLPDLFSWSQENLNSKSFLVSVPATELMFVLPEAAAERLPQFGQYVQRVTDGLKNLVSNSWFVLDESGITPFK